MRGLKIGLVIAGMWNVQGYNDNSRALAKALYNTNKNFRTCAKVIPVPIMVLYFPRPVVFPLAYAFIHRRGREPHWMVFRM